MQRAALVVTAVGLVAGILVAAYGFQMGLYRAVLLAPVILATAGATLFILILWGKVIVESLRRHDHPLRVLLLSGGALALLVVLSFFVELPGRGGH